MLSPSQINMTPSGSATGNPRNKCALKPGHSLMDWIRLGDSGVDLTGFQGRIMTIDDDELEKHNTREDAWLAISGNVYNVTRYMDFHPGGVDEIMRGVGKDASSLFHEVHSWVNCQQLLAKCYIGPYESSLKIRRRIQAANKTKTRANKIVKRRSGPPAEILPRFDWIQNASELSLYFYTWEYCNPCLILQCKSPNQLNVDIQIYNDIHKFEFEFHEELNWPPETNINEDKFEVSFLKKAPGIWTTYGTHLQTKTPSWSIENDSDELPLTFEVDSNEKFNHDSFELCLSNSNYIIMPAIGFHVTIEALINGQRVSRSYTPVDHKFAIKTKALLPSSCLRFLIKNYGKHGQLSSHLSQLNTGSILRLSVPRGSFTTYFLQNKKAIILLAAGSGITPCLNVLDYASSCRFAIIRRIILVYFNKTEADIWCDKEIKCIADSDERFKFVNVLSQPSSDWHGHSGHISTELLADILDTKILEAGTFVGICGPSGFNNLAETCIKDLKCRDKDVYIFQD